MQILVRITYSNTLVGYGIYIKCMKEKETEYAAASAI